MQPNVQYLSYTLALKQLFSQLLHFLNHLISVNFTLENYHQNTYTCLTCFKQGHIMANTSKFSSSKLFLGGMPLTSLARRCQVESSQLVFFIAISYLLFSSPAKTLSPSTSLLKVCPLLYPCCFRIGTS